MSWPRWDTENNYCLEKPLFSHSLIYVLIESAFSKVNSDYSYLVRRSLRRHEQRGIIETLLLPKPPGK
ncbi:hypothetical protein PAPYR_11579 [Paratrimastix pyriformis]|uniref:Uncharacterized protein n=1 Tax=Paratrimastix pyriformis TaxID=342808 RepID=A0ABQ8UAL6_9EUKA|nr:hypothetical protein PAPYR_11579 [Paratrimastix pyriformis]